MELDGWRMCFVFGYDVIKGLVQCVEVFDEVEYECFEWEVDDVFEGKCCTKQLWFKEEIVCECGFKNFVFLYEDVVEFDYQLMKVIKSYCMIVFRKSIDEERGQLWIDTHTRYFFYITNDREMMVEQVICEVNDCCNQEWFVEQFKSGVCVFYVLLNVFDVNWVYMVIVLLVWIFKVWFVLWFFVFV